MKNKPIKKPWVCPDKLVISVPPKGPEDRKTIVIDNKKKYFPAKPKAQQQKKRLIKITLQEVGLSVSKIQLRLLM